ncbi:hypothetical protein HID58_093106 [Brassica napus]|uniref:Uncharacterized protein n=1 Tax=Brassica napus TaxID=3708 RepID=A0ABQ7WZX5_BRANA|nr:hypothetical protein HID58_091456 [Brassica napus]KAH0853497.1 hypothetical protein HID58_093109 [Brassica napus]KAH0853547.1 hypothetical protein HID58_093106 [Brassica napus]
MSSSLLRNPNQSLSLSRNLLRSFKPIKCSSADSPYGGNVLTFPLTRVWDPYKRLGISPYASEEEIWASWFGALTVGWFCGSLVIPMIPTAFINPWTLELLTSLVAYTRLRAISFALVVLKTGYDDILISSICVSSTLAFIYFALALGMLTDLIDDKS